MIIGSLLYTRIEARYSPVGKSGFQVVRSHGLTDADIESLQPVYTPWNGEAARAMVHGDMLAVCRFTPLQASDNALYGRLIDACFRRGVYVASVKVWRLPRWTVPRTIKDVLRMV